MVNLDVASRVSGADTIIFNIDGQVMLCSEVLTGCSHQGLRLSDSYLAKVLENGSDVATGTIPQLYNEPRFVVSSLIKDDATGLPLGVVVVSRPTYDTTSIMAKISNIFMMVSLLVMGVCFVAMLFILKRQSEPLKQMSTIARSFGHGDLDARVRLSQDYPEEVEELALAFNNMAQELQKSEYQRKEFVANVSHELKTPMTTISGFAEGILDGTIPETREKESLHIIVSETRRLSRLVRRMLDLSRLDAASEKAVTAQEQFDLTEVASQVLISLEGKITSRGLDVDVQMPEDKLMVWGDPDSITQVCYNLMDNAAKFAVPGSAITLQMVKKDGKAFTTIKNLGATIPKEELPLLFDRFHKADSSRSQDREGVGLGLYIVKTIMSNLGESVTVTSEDGVTAFTFTLTLA